MEYRIISIPPFRAASSGLDAKMDFAPGGILEKFNAYFSAITPSPRDSFMPRDFLYYDAENQGLVWIWALCEGMDDGGNEVIDFKGGYYLTYSYRDGDMAENGRLHKGALEYIAACEALEIDPERYAMGHIITPAEIIKRQGWAQMETFIPVKLKP